jgi:hypothetical protein
MKIFIAAIIIVVLQQHIELIRAGTKKKKLIDCSFYFENVLAPCSSNPCRLVPGIYDSVTGYCCTDIPPSYTDAVCSCPNNATPVINGPCSK